MRRRRVVRCVDQSERGAALNQKPKSTEPTATPLYARPLAIALLGATFISLATLMFSSRPDPVGTESQATPREPDSAQQVKSRTLIRATFFDRQVEPQIAETDRLNRLAAQRCVDRMSDLIQRYQTGIPPFVKDLTSLSTRLGIVQRLPGDWWNEDERIEGYVRNKFERHFFSETLLLQDIARILGDFRDEVTVNQSRMIVTVKASLDSADLPEVDIRQYESFIRSISKELQSETADLGTASVYKGLMVLVTSEVGSFVAFSVAGGLIARVGTSIASSAAVGVGATAGATATGAGSGSLVGPVGTVVGLGVGLAVGLVIDWWMTEKFEVELTDKMEQYLETLEDSILSGSDRSMVAGGGLVDALPKVCDRLTVAYRERFYEQIVTVETKQ